MRTRAPRGTSALAASVILHVVIGAALLRVLTTPNALNAIFSRWGKPAPVERIGFLALPRTAAPSVAARAGGDGRPERDTPSDRPAPPVVSPLATPNSLPAVERAAPATSDGGSGEVVGEGGPIRGIRPSYNDPRLWLPSGPVVTAPVRARTRADSLHDLLADKIRFYNDSLAVANGDQRAPGDWTFTDKKGRKYGIDQQFIRLGKFSIPTALLGMLPLNAQANPIQLERQRAMTQMTREIQEQAARASRDDAFKAAVRALRERKDRERREAQAKAETPPAVIPAPAKP
ncbi:MAG: hypothetical protein P3B98_11205 [Gemmatimonadota bacterium]|nr:hypothetical protein [Gemmatimonadota bacterium]